MKLRSFSAAVFIASLTGSQACAAPPPASSLFFTPDEIRTIEAPKGDVAAPLATPDIHLGAVLYYGPDDWAVWLQGARWTPSSRRDDLQITGVKPGEVRLSWQPTPAAEPRAIILRPYQTYQTASGKVVEGLR